MHRIIAIPWIERLTGSIHAHTMFKWMTTLHSSSERSIFYLGAICAADWPTQSTRIECELFHFHICHIVHSINFHKHELSICCPLRICCQFKHASSQCCGNHVEIVLHSKWNLFYSFTLLRHTASIKPTARLSVVHVECVSASELNSKHWPATQIDKPFPLMCTTHVARVANFLHVRHRLEFKRNTINALSSYGYFEWTN